MTTTTNTEKAVRITKAMRYADIVSLLRDEAPKYGTTVDTAVEFIEAQVALLTKKNASKDKKLTATQEENVKLRELIMAYLRVQDSGKTCTEIMRGVPELSDLSNQKVAALLKRLFDDGNVVKAIVKGKSLFTVAEGV